MINGKVKSAAIIELYNEEGKYIGKQAKYNYVQLFVWRDFIIGLFAALLILHQVYMR